MSKEQFINSVLTSPPFQLVEELASESHETRRFPDPYIYIVEEGKLKTPLGELVEDFMEKDSYLGEIELRAFQEIQNWASESDSGKALWFSPPFVRHYTVSKIIISEILRASKGLKVLFNRAVVLDIDAVALFDLANSLSDSSHLSFTEDLRATPLFPSDHEFSDWIKNLSLVTTQTKYISSSQDLLLKTDTYVMISDIFRTIPIYHRQRDNLVYMHMHEEARQRDLIGDQVPSCIFIPTLTRKLSPFETTYNNSLVISEPKTLKCTCPFCNQIIEAIINNGKIHCPECRKSALYSC